MPEKNKKQGFGAKDPQKVERVTQFIIRQFNQAAQREGLSIEDAFFVFHNFHKVGILDLQHKLGGNVCRAAKETFADAMDKKEIIQGMRPVWVEPVDSGEIARDLGIVV